MVLLVEYFYVLGKIQKYSALSIGLRYVSKDSPTCYNNKVTQLSCYNIGSDISLYSTVSLYNPLLYLCTTMYEYKYLCTTLYFVYILLYL